MTANRTRWGLPYRPFLYTLDQIADMLGIPLAELHRFVHYSGRTQGLPMRGRLIARNICPDDGPGDWRVEEMELVRWMRWVGFTPRMRSSPRA